MTRYCPHCGTSSEKSTINSECVSTELPLVWVCYNCGWHWVDYDVIKAKLLPTTSLPVTQSKRPGELTPEEKWNEMKRELLENVKWYREQQANVKTDHFYFFLREGCTMDTLTYMMYLDGKDCKDTQLLIALLGKPAAYSVAPTPGRNK